MRKWRAGKIGNSDPGFVGCVALVDPKLPNAAKGAPGRQATSLQQRFRSVRFALYSTQELAAASESLLVARLAM